MSVLISDWDRTQKFIRQLMFGKKKILHNDDAKVINVVKTKRIKVPHIFNLQDQSKTLIHIWVWLYKGA